MTFSMGGWNCSAFPAILIVTVPSNRPTHAAGNPKVDPLTLCFQDRKRSDSSSNETMRPLYAARRGSGVI